MSIGYIDFITAKVRFEIELRVRSTHLYPKRGLQIPVTIGVLMCQSDTGLHDR
ncbi:MAG: hypothetical protein ACJATP_000774 [Candidatus Azotimanducaceae bacterium]|jgi:hypothetical protein